MIFKNLEPTDIVTGRTQRVSKGAFSNNEHILETFYTSSTQVNQSSSISHPEDVLNGAYYVNVYNQQPFTNVAETIVNEAASVQFSISYGHRYGSGSYQDVDFSQTGSNPNGIPSATKTIYSQWRNALLSPTDQSFTFSGSTATDASGIYVIQFSADRQKERVDEGAWALKLSAQAISGSTIISSSIELVDDSNIVRGSGTEAQGGKVFNILRNEDDVEYEGLGLFYPDLGSVVLNSKKVAEVLGNELSASMVSNGGFTSNEILGNEGYQLSGSLVTTGNQQNFLKLFDKIEKGSSFRARATEYIPTKHYFIRVKNQDFNYSNNPTFVYSAAEAVERAAEDRELGLTPPDYTSRIRHEEFINDPRVYPTSVGLYNDNNELVAVAKLSNPILKTFDSEFLIKVSIPF